MSTKNFNVVGFSKDKAEDGGETKLRFATDLAGRVKILQACGCTNINLVELPAPMAKLPAMEWMKTNMTLTPEEDAVLSLKLEDAQVAADKAAKKAALAGKPKATVGDVLAAVTEGGTEATPVTAETRVAEEVSVSTETIVTPEVAEPAAEAPKATTKAPARKATTKAPVAKKKAPAKKAEGKAPAAKKPARKPAAKKAATAVQA